MPTDRPAVCRYERAELHQMTDATDLRGVFISLNRLSSRLPVSVLVRDYPRTRTLYRYYTEAVENLRVPAQ
jgi:hypothetical protein